MDNQHHHATGTAASRELLGSVPAKFFSARPQAEPLGSLASIVKSTLGLSLEEAQQMEKDLGFQRF